MLQTSRFEPEAPCPARSTRTTRQVRARSVTWSSHELESHDQPWIITTASGPSPAES